MNATQFIIKEKKALWKDYGIEEPETLLKSIPKKLPSRPSLNSLADIQKWLGDCQRCGLCQERKKIVFGVGDEKAQLMFIGEGPGADEDMQGLPFVGRAGQLLDKIIEAMKLKREQVYIANIVKCRPPGNRAPLPEEANTCLPFLKAQIDFVKPKMIVCLGSTATTYLLQNAMSMSQLRGRFHYLPFNPKIQVMPTYHPAYLLRNPDAKKMVWEDMKKVMAEMQ